jgi:hypothetical protein
MGRLSKRQTLQNQGLATQSFAVLFVNGTAEQKTDITKSRIDPCEKTQFQVKVCQKSTAKILLQPLHIKLGLRINFVKAIKKHGKSFEYLKKKHFRNSVMLNYTIHLYWTANS